MAGSDESGKTTQALKIAQWTGAHFFSLEETINSFNRTILTLHDYEMAMYEALKQIAEKAILILSNNRSVVFDFGGGELHWPWLREIAEIVGAKIEIYDFESKSETLSLDAFPESVRIIKIS